MNLGAFGCIFMMKRENIFCENINDLSEKITTDPRVLFLMYGNYRVDLGRIAGSGIFEPSFSLCPPGVYGIFYCPTKENLT